MQLDFDLAGSSKKPEPPPVFTVTGLTKRIRELLDRSFKNVWVEGEISNARHHRSGHVYFTLKDAGCEISSVLYANQAARLRGIEIKDGAQVKALGDVSVFERRGQYQLVVRSIQPVGAGALQAKFEELKARLAAEGLFDAARKRPLPKFPQRIGVVTSPTGAAIRDFLHVLHRRQRGIEVVIHPARVQGRGAADEIVAALEALASGAWGRLDVIVLTRGGGSIEDLWEFNEEKVARAIAACPLPVVSAVGHEIDFTISDFAADLRAPTPSAAAEILSADGAKLLEELADTTLRLRRCALTQVRSFRDQLEGLQRTALFQAPLRSARELAQVLDRGEDDLRRRAASLVQSRRLMLGAAASRLSHLSPAGRIAAQLASLAGTVQKMSHLCVQTAAVRKGELARCGAVLQALDPRAAMARGFTLTLDANGRAVRSVVELAPGVEILTRFADGQVRSVVSEESRPIDSTSAAE